VLPSEAPLRPPLHVIFTLDCPPYGARCQPSGPSSWEASARSIDAFCTTLLRAGFPPTLFVTPETAYEHGPLLADLRDAGSGAEVGLLLQPPSLRQAGFHDPGARHRQTLDELLEHLDVLEERYETVPSTVSGAYAHLRSR